MRQNPEDFLNDPEFNPCSYAKMCYLAKKTGKKEEAESDEHSMRKRSSVDKI